MSATAAHHIDVTSPAYRELARTEETPANYGATKPRCRRLKLQWPDASVTYDFAFGRNVGACRRTAQHRADLWRDLGAVVLSIEVQKW